MHTRVYIYIYITLDLQERQQHKGTNEKKEHSLSKQERGVTVAATTKPNLERAQGDNVYGIALKIRSAKQPPRSMDKKIKYDKEMENNPEPLGTCQEKKKQCKPPL